MDDTSQEREVKKKFTQIKTYPVPFALGGKKGNITVNSNTPTQTSKEQIINQAFKFHSEVNISEAATHYQLFINQGFKDYRVFYNFGVILKDLGKLQEAERSMRKAIEINHDYAIAHNNLGNILKDLGKLKEAEVSTRKAIQLNPDLTDAHSNLGSILRNLGKLKDAKLCSQKIMSLRPWSIMGSYSFNYEMIQD